MRAIGAIIDDLRMVLEEIQGFSENHNCRGFTICFSDALKALDSPEADIGYHKDLFPTGSLSAEAVSILKAAQRAWAFGGMGSWNDMAFEDQAQIEYEQLSDKLFDLLNEAVEAAATSSMKQKAN